MKIYDLIMYDDIDIYMRDDVGFNSSNLSQSRLAKWFVTESFTEEIFIELLKMKSFKLQNSKEASDSAMERFKDFMANYFLDNPNLTQKSFNMTVAYLIENDNFRHNTDQILQSDFCTEKIFNYALDADFLGTARETLHIVFKNLYLSEKTLLKYMERGFDYRYWSSMIKYQKLSDKLVKKIIELSKYSDEIIIILVENNHNVDITTFLKVISNHNNGFGDLEPAVAIKKMILKDRHLIDDVFLWKPIFEYLEEDGGVRNASIIFQAILTYDNIPENIIDMIVSKDYILDYIKDNMNLDKFNDNTKSIIYEKTGKEEFLSDEVKDIFLF